MNPFDALARAGRVCLVLIAALLVLAFATGRASAAPLAIVCDALTVSTDLQSCTGGHYRAHPSATDIVRKGTGWTDFRPATFGSLAATDTLDACEDASVVDGAAYPWPFNGSLDPCKDWGVYPASTFDSVPAGTPAEMVVTWVLPTNAIDGTPLAGEYALTGVQLFVSTAPIADDSTVAPTSTFAGNVVQSTFSGTVPNGATLYVRVKAVNKGGASAFSVQASKLIQVPVAVPGQPTDVTIAIRITP